MKTNMQAVQQIMMAAATIVMRMYKGTGDINEANACYVCNFLAAIAEAAQRQVEVEELEKMATK